VPVDKGRAVQLTDSPARDRYAAYSPDGEKVAFVSDRSGEEQVYIINADGTGLQQVTHTDTRKLEIDWSPDGKYMSVIESDHSFWIYDLEKKDKRLIMKPEPSRPRNIRWSPDGKWIAYTKNNRDFWSDIYIISATEEKPVEHPISERMPYDEYSIFFTPKKIFFLGQMNDEWDLALFSVDLARQEVDPDDPDAKAKKKKKEERASERRREARRKEGRGKEIR